MGRDEVRQRILEAAGEVFADKGFKSATVRQICEKADANVAAINYYFGDKEKLYIEAVKNARRLREQEVPLPAWSDATPPDERLRILIQTLLRRMLAKDAAPWQTRLVVREIIEPTQACQEMVQEAIAPFFQILVGVVRSMMPERTPEHRLHQIGFSVIAQCVFYRVHNKMAAMIIGQDELDVHYQIDQLAEHIAEVTLAALGAQECLREQFSKPHPPTKLQRSP